MSKEVKHTKEPKGDHVTLYTMQLAHWRRLSQDEEKLLDITVKSGKKEFAPNKELLYAYKSGEVSVEEFTERYTTKMRKSFKDYPLSWNALLLPKKIVISCYCRAGEFCHRHLFKGFLTRYLDSVGVSVKDGGELFSEID